MPRGCQKRPMSRSVTNGPSRSASVTVPAARRAREASAGAAEQQQHGRAARLSCPGSRQTSARAPRARPPALGSRSPPTAPAPARRCLQPRGAASGQSAPARSAVRRAPPTRAGTAAAAAHAAARPAVRRWLPAVQQRRAQAGAAHGACAAQARTPQRHSPAAPLLPPWRASGSLRTTCASLCRLRVRGSGGAAAVQTSSVFLMSPQLRLELRALKLAPKPATLPGA
jgi:hypothetical protein